MVRKRNRVFLFMIVLLALVLLAVYLYSFSQKPPAPLPEGQALAEVYTIDVGQGDSTLIDIGEYEILIDGGERAAGGIVSEFLEDKVDGKLDLVIATHPDADHIGGLIDVLERYPVGEIIDSGKVYNTKTYRTYRAAAEDNGAVFSEDEDRVIPIADGVTFTVIECADNQKNNNDNSVVTCLTTGNQKLLFTGDMEADIEQEYLHKFEDVSYLKVGHHGSTSSSCAPFLDCVRPEYAVISCGKGNKYGHPHKETLDTLQKRDIQIFRTDRQGTIWTRCYADRLEFFALGA